MSTNWRYAATELEGRTVWVNFYLGTPRKEYVHLDARGTIPQIDDILFGARNFPSQLGCDLKLGTSCIGGKKSALGNSPKILDANEATPLRTSVHLRLPRLPHAESREWFVVVHKQDSRLYCTHPTRNASTLMLGITTQQWRRVLQRRIRATRCVKHHTTTRDSRERLFQPSPTVNLRPFSGAQT